MANDTKRRDLRKEAFWRRTIDRHASSGLSVRAWCRKQGLKEAAFYRWRGELVRRDARNKQSAFVPVHVTGDKPKDADPQIEIVLTDGRCVRVTGSVDAQMLAEVLDLLERRAC